MNELALSPPPPTFVDLVPANQVPSSEHPALVYLASLAPGSRRTMRQALDVVAGILTADLCDHLTMPWVLLRFQHTQAVRSVLMERYSPKTANKMLSALKQTLKVAWNLGYLTAEEYQRAVSLKPERFPLANGRHCLPPVGTTQLSAGHVMRRFWPSYGLEAYVVPNWHSCNLLTTIARLRH